MTYGKIATNLVISILVTFFPCNVLHCTCHLPTPLLQLEPQHWKYVASEFTSGERLK